MLFKKPQEQDGTSQTLQILRDIGEKAWDAAARFVILWGSQSKTAEAVAIRLGRDIQQRLESTAIVGDLSGYDPATLANVSRPVVVVLVMSTRGEGDPSDNATWSTHEELFEWTEAFYSLRNSKYGLYDHKAVYRPTIDLTVEKSASDISRDGERDDAPFPGQAILLPTSRGMRWPVTTIRHDLASRPSCIWPVMLRSSQVQDRRPHRHLATESHR